MPGDTASPSPVATLLDKPVEVHCAAYGFVLGYCAVTPHARVGGVAIGSIATAARVRRELARQPQYAIGTFLVGVLCGLVHRHIQPDTHP